MDFLCEILILKEGGIPPAILVIWKGLVVGYKGMCPLCQGQVSDSTKWQIQTKNDIQGECQSKALVEGCHKEQRLGDVCLHKRR